MMRTKHRMVPGVESMEKRDVPSTFSFGMPVLTTRALSTAIHSLDRALGTVAKTHDFNRLNWDLAKLSSRLPYGLRTVYGNLQSDMSIYDPTVRGSGLVMRQQMVSDLRSYAVSGIANHQFIVKGPGASFYYQAAANYYSG
jgi:hypothetical protein